MKRDPFFQAAAVGAALFIAGVFVDGGTAFPAFLAAYGTVLFTVLGALFFVLLHHVVDAGWSVVVRRWAENLLAALPPLAAAGLVIVLGAGSMFHWTHADPASDPLMAVKEPWLNTPFLAVRLVIYFATWIVIARLYRGGSIEQDETGDPAISLRLRKCAGPCLVAYGLTTSFAAMDLWMTPDHHWYSTMFGPYVWAQGVVAFFAVLALLAFRFRAGELADKVPDGALRTIGMWLFAFAAFWGYLAACQWLLIWYANIPEETVWFIHRWEHGWQVLGGAMAVGLFVVPFVVLLSAENKQRPVLRVVAWAALVGHWLGALWIVMPTVHGGSLLAAALAAPGAMLFVAGIAGRNVAAAFRASSPYPTQDPRLGEALAEGHH